MTDVAQLEALLPALGGMLTSPTPPSSQDRLRQYIVEFFHAHTVALDPVSVTTASLRARQGECDGGPLAPTAVELAQAAEDAARLVVAATNVLYNVVLNPEGYECVVVTWPSVAAKLATMTVAPTTTFQLGNDVTARRDSDDNTAPEPPSPMVIPFTMESRRRMQNAALQVLSRVAGLRTQFADFVSQLTVPVTWREPRLEELLHDPPATTAPIVEYVLSELHADTVYEGDGAGRPFAAPETRVAALRLAIVLSLRSNNAAKVEQEYLRQLVLLCVHDCQLQSVEGVKVRSWRKGRGRGWDDFSASRRDVLYLSPAVAHRSPQPLAPSVSVRLTGRSAWTHLTSSRFSSTPPTPLSLSCPPPSPSSCPSEHRPLSCSCFTTTTP